MIRLFIILMLLGTFIHGQQPSTQTSQKQITQPVQQPPQPSTQAQQPAQQQPKPKKVSINPFTAPIATKTIAGKQQIPLSATLALSGAQSIIGKELFDGMNLYFNKMKEQKDLSFMVHLSTLDDTFKIAKAEQNIIKLCRKSPIVVSLFGTDIITILKSRIQKQLLLGLFPIEGVESLRGEELKNLVYFRTTHKKELETLVNYSVKKLNKKKIAIFYEAGEWGERVLEELKRVLKDFDLTLVAQAWYPQKTVNITAAVDTISKAAPNAIFCIAQARPAYNFIRQILNKGLHNTVFFGISSLFSIQQTLKRARGVRTIISSVVPDPFKSNLEIAKEFRADMQKYLPNKNITPFCFEGYINAALTVEYIKRTGFPITPQKLRTTIENTMDFNFKGLELSFDETTRTLCNNVWLNKGKDKEWPKI
ncbi:MAG: ABC transporter substrate-binding protein [bacterium]